MENSVVEHTASDRISAPLADAIRNISAMIQNGANCTDVCAAAVQCAVSMLPGARAIVAEVHEEPSIAAVLSVANAPFLSAGQEIGLARDCILTLAKRQPHRVHEEACADSNQLCATTNGYPGEPDELVIAKAVPSKDGDSMVMAIVCGPDLSVYAHTVLMTLSELLVALCAGHKASVLHNQGLIDIARAKREWERTVDALPELVCLIDQDGRVVRANRTVERWNLGKVNKVQGLHVHNLLHRNCSTDNCPLRDSVSLSMAAQSSNGFLESAVTDTILNRMLLVHTRLMDGMLDEFDGASRACAIVVVSDVSALQKAQQELAKLNVELENRVRKRTNELELSVRELADEVARRCEAEVQLQSSRDELADLSEQLINAQEDERRRLSRELHDSLGQSLGAIKYSLERVAAMHQNPTHGDPADEIAEIINSVGRAIRETRSMAMSLRPPVLDDIGTAAAIGWLCQHFAETFTDIAFHIEIDVPNSEIPDALSTPIYRIVQEALNNVVKHASAEAVMVSLRLVESTLTLEVLDDGIGFETHPGDTGTFQSLGKIGRLGMRERALNSNGKLTVESWPDEGTKVTGKWLLQSDPNNLEKPNAQK